VGQEPLKAPYLLYDELRRRATEFLSSYHPSGSIPVPIEEIIEFTFGIDIIPVPDLQTTFDTVGFLSSDMTTITVDSFVQNKRIPRYRFTLAHELAHLVLHAGIFGSVSFSTTDEWKEFQNSISPIEYGWLELQANNFAGLILVPPGEFETRFSKAMRSAARAGMTAKNASEVLKEYVHAWLGKQFNVSADVIEKRADREKVWNP